MPWNEEKSKKRVESCDFQNIEVNVQDLRRSMDFNNLGTKDVRRAQGVHLYVDIPSFNSAVAAAGNDKQKQRRLIRAASVLRKVQRDLLNADDIGDIQRQTVRLHALAYKPYDADDKSESAKRAELAVIHAITHNSYVHDVFADVFDDESGFDCAVGLASGVSYLANIGRSGSRELISLGSCANLAAKILGNGDTITVTEEIRNELPEKVQERFKKGRVVSGTQTYVATNLRWSMQPELAEDLGVEWNVAKWKKITEEYRDALPLNDVEISEATVRIDVHTLTERNCKRTDAVTLFADLDGFTKYVQSAENDDAVISLIRQFHMIRAELHAVFERDYDGIVLQHRGDCVLGIAHLPPGDQERASRCDEAVDIAVGMQSSMIDVLNKHLVDRKDIDLAVGLEVGKTLVTRLGKKGQRISICFGPNVNVAEQLQRSTGGKKIRISQSIYDLLTDDVLKDRFKKDGDSYVAAGLTFRKLDEEREANAADAGSLGAAVEDGCVSVSTSATAGNGQWHNSKPWGMNQ